jgi:glycosyltransferase involved in cell wall biosynthesis
LILSIIIPAYNAQDYIDRCIHSALKQDLNPSDYEIIVVDDGSSDQTGKFVTEIASQFTNVKLITQENKGEGGARNTGIKGAQGKYILFLDQDDYLIENTIHQLIQIADKEDLDILMADHFHEKTGDTPFKNAIFNTNSTEIVSGKEFLKINAIAWPVWVYLFKRGFLSQNNLLFRDKGLFTDAEFSLRSIFHAEKMMYVDIFFYSWINNPRSVSHGRWSIQKVDEELASAKAISLFSQSTKKDNNDVYLLLQNHIHAIFWTTLKHSTAVGFVQTLKICNAIKEEQLGLVAPIKYNLLFKFLNNLIQVCPACAAVFIFGFAHSLRTAKGFIKSSNGSNIDLV